VKPRRHRKLTDVTLEVMRSQARLIVQVIPYKELAPMVGLSYDGTKQLMADLIREVLEAKPVPRVTHSSELTDAYRELGL
jgi:hypothetical protein